MSNIVKARLTSLGMPSFSSASAKGMSFSNASKILSIVSHLSALYVLLFTAGIQAYVFVLLYV
jgi:F0F1-type ATP synthase membrane subunit a